MVDASQDLLFILPVFAWCSLSPVCLIVFLHVFFVWFIILSNGVLDCRHCKEDENAERFNAQK